MVTRSGEPSLESVDPSCVPCFGDEHKPCLAGSGAALEARAPHLAKRGIPWLRPGYLLQDPSSLSKSTRKGEIYRAAQSIRTTRGGWGRRGAAGTRGGTWDVQGALPTAHVQRSRGGGSLRDTLPPVPAEEGLVIRGQILPLPLFGIKDILSSSPPSSDEGHAATDGSQKVQ